MSFISNLLVNNNKKAEITNKKKKFNDNSK